VDGIGRDEPDVAIDAAVEREAHRQRRDGRVVAVVHLDGHEVLVRAAVELQQSGDVDGEGGVAALVPAGKGAVHVHRRHLVRALEVQEDAPAPQGAVQRDPLAIPPDAAPVARCVVERIAGVPGVGQRHALPRLVGVRGLLGEVQPVGVVAPPVVDGVARPLRGEGMCQQQRRTQQRHPARAKHQ
jgi:hypothetical protein